MHIANLYWLISDQKDVKPFYHLSSDVINEAYDFWSSMGPRKSVERIRKIDWCWAGMSCKGVIDRGIIRGSSGRTDETDLVEEFSIEVGNVRRTKRTNKVL